MYYFEVGVGVERHWKSAVFTYASDEKLSIGEIVRVPFGTTKRTGLVLTAVPKPAFTTKKIYDRLSVSLSENTQSFIHWFSSFYGITDGEAYAQFLPRYITKQKLVHRESSIKSMNNSLNSPQKKALQALRETARPVVLQGITGSGKTRVYTRVITDTLKGGRNALVLYPEISLTSQLVRQLEQITTVFVFHSHLTSKERSTLWLQVANAEQPIIIAGPRSALFLPHTNLGLIVVDEAHEVSYKQESDIRYNGLLVAGGLARSHQARLILGSATPPINETELLLRNGGSVIAMNEKAISSDYVTEMHIIDMKNRLLFKKHPLLSDQLLSSIHYALESNKQSLIFLNRRGTAKLLFCESCSWQFECLSCDLPMTYHHDLHKMICHTCGRKSSVIAACPDCNEETSMRSFGSKALVEEVKKLFPTATIARFDSDNSKDESFNQNYDDVISGKIDILIGTQQLTKGIDLPHLHTVGVLQADLSLHFPDYTSNERTFQLLSQIAGRVGRGHGSGRVFIQTYQPNNPVIQLALKEDWDGFKSTELVERKKHNFPPYIFRSKLIIREKTLQKSTAKAEKVLKSISALQLPIEIDGPLPSFQSKKGGYFYMQIHLSSTKRAHILKACTHVPDWVIKDLDPSTLL
jgi:primosomal protein N' (replication factor Y)